MRASLSGQALWLVAGEEADDDEARIVGGGIDGSGERRGAERGSLIVADSGG
jgi:hypothetical protein